MDMLQFCKRSKTRVIQGPTWALARIDVRHLKFTSDGATYARGRMRIVFDMLGRAIEGWSYDTCIFCYAPPCEDYPQGRVLRNTTAYGNTTSGHVSRMWPFFAGDTQVIEGTQYKRVVKTVRMSRWYACDGTVQLIPITRETRAYTSERITRRMDQVDLAADQDGWGYGVSPDDMRQRYALRATYARTRREPEIDLYCVECGVEIYHRHDLTVPRAESTCESCELELSEDREPRTSYGFAL